MTEPFLPAGTRIYAIGDVHGRRDLLDRLLRAIADDRATRPIEQAIVVLLGDLVDRGPKSRQVVELALNPPDIVDAWVTIKGNHEVMLLESATNDDIAADWWRYGGDMTARSYGVDVPLGIKGARADRKLLKTFHKALPADHRKFLDERPTMARFGSYVFVHAGIRPGVPFDDQDGDDLMWIREEFLEAADDFGAIVVHGHTPVSQVEVKPNRINVDVGGYATHRLAAAVLEGNRIGSMVVGMAGVPAFVWHTRADTLAANAGYEARR